MGSRFVELPKNKWDWHPSPVPGQIVYLTTVNAEETVNVSPKSWISMASFDPPVVGFGCREDHQTLINAVARGRFTINFPTAEQADKSFAMANAPRQERLRAAGFTLEASAVDAVAHLAECPAYAECTIHDITRFPGGAVFVWGVIGVVAVLRRIGELKPAEAYAALSPAFFLEPGVVARLGPISRPDA